MQLIDDQLAQLQTVTAPRTARDDFDAFWNDNLRRVADVPLNVVDHVVDYPIDMVEVHDLTFDGIDGTPVETWLLLPRHVEAPYPVVIDYHGHGGSRRQPTAHLPWVAMGCAVIAHDWRMQGGLTGSATGFTGHRALSARVLGCLDEHDSIFRYAWTDALRAVRLARSLPDIDADRIAVIGISQGGGTALAVASLDTEVAACLPDVPSSLWLEKRLFDRSGGVKDLASFLADHPDKLDAVANAQSYFDLINLVDRIRCPVLMSCGLKDPVCPPETVYAGYNIITSEKQMCAYPLGEHGGGGAAHLEVKLAWLKKKFS